jgi:hypothetical protein
MRRNNLVFLVGEVLTYAQRDMEISGEIQPVIDMLLLTDNIEVSGQHKVMVRGRQAHEMSYFLAAAALTPLEVMILGWLYSGKKENIVIAERVTAIVDRKTRQVAIAAIRSSKELELPKAEA